MHNTAGGICASWERHACCSPGFPLLALQALDECGFLAADVGPGTPVHENVEVIAGTARVAAQESVLVGLHGRNRLIARARFGVRSAGATTQHKLSKQKRGTLSAY
jgi:hypothetical protein